MGPVSWSLGQGGKGARTKNLPATEIAMQAAEGHVRPVVTGEGNAGGEQNIGL